MLIRSPNGRGGKKKWIQLKVYKDRIEQTISDEKIEFENQMGGCRSKKAGSSETLVNSTWIYSCG